jgi:hypothetical protein
MGRHKRSRTRTQPDPAIEAQAESETGFSEVRTTRAEYPPFKAGCPKCHGPVITRQRLYSRDVENIEILACRCRTPGCDWEGRLMR